MRVSKRVEGGLLRGGSDQPHANSDDVCRKVLQVRMEVCKLKCEGWNAFQPSHMVGGGSAQPRRMQMR